MASSNTSSMILPPLAPKQVDKPEQLASTEPSKSAKPTKDKDEDGSGIEELAMPRTMIQRLAKSALPPSTQLQKDALLALSKSATLFINHIAGSALEDLPPNKKTIQPANVFAALEQIEFTFMIPVLKAELEKFVAIQTNKREEYKKKLKDGKGGGVDGSTMLVGDEDSIADGLVQTRGADPGAQLEAESAIDRQRSAKRAKGIGGAALTAADNDDDEEDEEEDDVDMAEADAVDAQDDEVEGETDQEATESEEGSENEAVQEDGVGTELEDDVDEENDSRTEEESD